MDYQTSVLDIELVLQFNVRRVDSQYDYFDFVYLFTLVFVTANVFAVVEEWKEFRPLHST